MRSRLTGNQPETLDTVVALIQANQGVFPTIAQLADSLGVAYDAARARLRRLRELGFVVAVGARTYKLSSDLCTEPETALLLLRAHELAEANSQGKVFKSDLARVWEKVRAELGVTAPVSGVLDACLQHSYFQVIVSDLTSLRPTQSLTYQLEYLRRRASSRRDRG